MKKWKDIPDWSVTAKNRKAVEEMEASFNKHSQEEIENVYESLARLVAHAGASVTYPKRLRRGDELEILGFLPPRPEPAAKPESIIAEASGTHVLERTSRKGHPFVGRCSGCGVEGPASLAREKCPAAKPKETQE